MSRFQSVGGSGSLFWMLGVVLAALVKSSGYSREECLIVGGTFSVCLLLGKICTDVENVLAELKKR